MIILFKADIKRPKINPPLSYKWDDEEPRGKNVREMKKEQKTPRKKIRKMIGGETMDGKTGGTTRDGKRDEIG